VESSVAAAAAIRPWRTATLVASAVAVLELCVILVAGVALLTKPVATRVQAEATEPVLATANPASVEPKQAEAAGPTLPRTETSVLVLNGNGRTGAASESANRLHGVGYIVGGVGNAPRSDYGRSVVMYRPGRRREAQRLARDLKLKIVGPLDGLPLRQLMGAHLALVVGA
jgi:LytR cell envelope-related transcriptional attenuator